MFEVSRKFCLVLISWKKRDNETDPWGNTVTDERCRHFLAHVKGYPPLCTAIYNAMFALQNFIAHILQIF